MVIWWGCWGHHGSDDILIYSRALCRFWKSRPYHPNLSSWGMFLEGHWESGGGQRRWGGGMVALEMSIAGFGVQNNSSSVTKQYVHKCNGEKMNNIQLDKSNVVWVLTCTWGYSSWLVVVHSKKRFCLQDLLQVNYPVQDYNIRLLCKTNFITVNAHFKCCRTQCALRW